MSREISDPADYALAILRKRHRESAQAIVRALLKRFQDLDEEGAGEVIWNLIDAHRIRVTDEADLEANDAIAAG